VITFVFYLLFAFWAPGALGPKDWLLGGLQAAVLVGLTYGFYKRWRWAALTALPLYVVAKLGLAWITGTSPVSVLGVLVFTLLGRAFYAAWKHPRMF